MNIRKLLMIMAVLLLSLSVACGLLADEKDDIINHEVRERDTAGNQHEDGATTEDPSQTPVDGENNRASHTADRCQTNEPDIGEDQQVFELHYVCDQQLHPVYRTVPADQELSLEEMIQTLLEGPTEEEQEIGFENFFVQMSSDWFISLEEEDEHVLINLKDFSHELSNIGTSYGMWEFFNTFDHAIFTHSEYNEVSFAFEGSEDQFCHFFQIICEPATREQWEERKNE